MATFRKFLWKVLVHQINSVIDDRVGWQSHNVTYVLNQWLNNFVFSEKIKSSKFDIMYVRIVWE